MSEIALLMSKKDIKKEDQDIEIIKKLNEIEDLIDTANNIFDFVTDKELIDSTIYELNSLYKKYTYYIKVCKERGIVNKGI